MGIEIGRQIRNFRQKKGTTQEELARFLSISPQAVSKWENGISTPDIELLPQISIYFGIKIDELFEITREEQYERIQNSIWNDLHLKQEEFNHNLQYLKEAIEENERDIKAYVLLAGLYNFAAQNANKKAAFYAKLGLKKDPDNRQLHVELTHAFHGVTGDGYLDHQPELIDYYKNFVKHNPKNKLAYKNLIKQLLADGRLKEAEEIIVKAEQLGEEYYYMFYRGDLFLKSGNYKEAMKYYNKAVEKWSEKWQSWCTRADRLLTFNKIDEAILDYQKCFEIQKVGNRVVDGLLSLAQIYKEQNNLEEELKIWEIYLQVLKEDYHNTKGEYVEKIQKRIIELENKLK